jgi:pimeloyl-ACP methyl ester carboxylesterase
MFKKATVMTKLAPLGSVVIGQSKLDYRMIGPSPDQAPTLVLLHEGLGCQELWGDFPEKLAAETGAGVFVYSREGYGRSSKVTLPRPLDYMQREGLHVLPKILEVIGFQRGLLIGHSDGASIATIYAGGVQDHRIRGLSLIAPHFIVEDMGLSAIRDTRKAFEIGDLRAKLTKYHRDVDGAFKGWNDAWLDPGFKTWDISESLGYIRVPVQIIQGDKDPYGTIRQIHIAEEECYCPVDVTMLPGIGHSPHRESAEVTLQAVSNYANRILTLHGEAAYGKAA